MSVAANDGSCCPMRDAANQCDPTDIWVVRSVEVTLRDPATDLPIAGVAPRIFPCQQREATTAFDLPSGTYAIGLAADVFDGAGNPAPSAVPPPEVHTIVRGDVVNLQVIEIGVHPLPVSGAGPFPCRWRAADGYLLSMARVDLRRWAACRALKPGRGVMAPMRRADGRLRCRASAVGGGARSARCVPHLVLTPAHGARLGAVAARHQWLRRAHLRRVSCSTARRC